MVTMLLDHMSKFLLPQYSFLVIIGRISFPIFAYMIAEGCTHTKNRSKYLLSILCLSMICQIGFWVVSASLYMNILVTFALSVITIYSIDFFVKKKNFSSAVLLILELYTVIFLCFFLKDIISSTDFKIDYGFLGVMLPVAVYYLPKKSWKIICTAVILCFMAITSYNLKLYALLSIPFLAVYNGKRGKANLKYLFYIFYPTHFVIIYGIEMLLN